MRFEISRSLNGDTVLFIARDSSGVVRFREKTLEDLQEAIKNYQPPKKHQAEVGDKNKTEEVIVNEKEVQEESTSPTLTETDKEDTVEVKKEFLQSETKEIIETKRKSSGKKTFWDKLK